MEHDMSNETSFRAVDGGYDVRRLEGKVLIHIGMVHRASSHRWVATRPGTQATTEHRTRRDAIAELSS